MESIVKERIMQFIKHCKISRRAFEIKCGLSSGYVNNIRVSIHPDKIESIAANYPELNIAWLMTGEGEMLRKVVPQKGEARVEECRGVPFFISARGRSMLDISDPSHSIPDGAMVMCRPKSGSFIEWGEIYCVATREGYVIKKLMPSEDDAYIRCVSTNEAEFPPYEIPKAEIVGIGRVIAVVSVLRL